MRRSIWFFPVASALTLLTAATSALSQPPTLFHGTSIVIQPSRESDSVADAGYYGANFFCYMTEKGYLSFGWWVPPNSHSNTSHCRPESSTFHWYEHSSQRKSNLTDGTFDFLTENVSVRAPSNAEAAEPLPFPSRPLHYHIRALALGNHEHGELAVSYVDEEDMQFHAVGTRQVLSNSSRDSKTSSDCQKALDTLNALVQRYELQDLLDFSLDDGICGGQVLIKQSADMKGVELQAVAL